MVLPTITKKQKIIFLLSFLFCFFIQVIPVIRSGLNYDFGIGFWGPNGHDGVWHLSLINNLHNPLKIDMPIFAGETLKNYHPFFNILIALLAKITSINSSVWLFQLFPIITTILFLYFSFKLGFNLTKTFLGALSLMILNSLNNSFGWIITLFRDGRLGGESLFWAMQSPSNQLNPPFMLSILLITIFLYLLTLKKPSKYALFFTVIFLPIIKVYSAVPAFIIFFFYVLKHKQYRPTFVLSLLISAALFLIYNSSSGGLVQWHPFWFIKSMVESEDRLYLPYFANMRYALESSGKIGPRLIFFYIFFTAVFIVGNYAWRLLALFKVKNYPPIWIATFICFLVPLLFIQKGTSWNTIQFMYYSLFLINIPLCLFLTKYPKIAFLIIFFNLFPLIGSLPSFLGKTPPAAISHQEQQALNFLKSQPKGIVLTTPYDSYLKKSYPNTPLPLYVYETTSYLAAYGQQPVFMADEMNLENSAYPWQERRLASENFFAQKNEFQDRGFLVNNQIDYLYLPKAHLKNINLDLEKMFLLNIYENPEIIIYKVQR